MERRSAPDRMETMETLVKPSIVMPAQAGIQFIEVSGYRPAPA